MVAKIQNGRPLYDVAFQRYQRIGFGMVEDYPYAKRMIIIGPNGRYITIFKDGSTKPGIFRP